MTSRNSTGQGLFSDKPFLVLVAAVSMAFAWIVWPFFGAVLWATVLAILFSPFFDDYWAPAAQAHARRADHGADHLSDGHLAVSADRCNAAT